MSQGGMAVKLSGVRALAVIGRGRTYEYDDMIIKAVRRVQKAFSNAPHHYVLHSHGAREKCTC
eukprot:25736-Prorocentrum_minimum.AAC.9